MVTVQFGSEKVREGRVAP